jgi:ABC-type sugar transport system permease subunit
MKPRVAPYLFVAPFFLAFGAFWLVPIGASFWYSLTEWRGITPPAFVGARNYAMLANSPRFHAALINTLVMASAYVILANAAALSLALLLDTAWMRAKRFFRTAFFLPMSISVVVGAVVFQLVYAGEIGLIAKLVAQLGFRGPAWLQEEGWATAAIVLMRVWRTAGYYAVIYLAALQAVPPELREAARIDGAGPFGVFRHAVLPAIRPVMLFCVVIATISGLEMFDEVSVLTQGGPADSTLTVALYLYQQGFQFLELGHAAAASYVLTLLVVVISVIQKRLLARED